MNNQQKNILGLYVKIIDVDKCHFELNFDSETNFLWVNQFLRNMAGISEWEKYNYIPKNGDIGEIVARLVIPSHHEVVYIIRTFGMFYVPISVSGFIEIKTKQSMRT